MCHLFGEKNVPDVRFTLLDGPLSMLTNPSAALNALLFSMRVKAEPVFTCARPYVCTYGMEGVCWCTHVQRSLTRLQWHGSLFVAMATESGLSRDVRPDDGIRLHQWGAKSGNKHRGEQGNGCREGGGAGSRQPVNQRDHQAYANTHTCTHAQRWAFPDTHARSTGRLQNLIILEASVSLKPLSPARNTHTRTQPMTS